MARKLSKPRPPHGARLVELREAAGLTQQELASALGLPQSTIALWERSARPPRSDVLPRMAAILDVTVEELLRVDTPARASRGRRPTGKLWSLFDQVSKLPRRQQEKVAEFVSLYLKQYEGERAVRQGRS